MREWSVKLLGLTGALLSALVAVFLCAGCGADRNSAPSPQPPRSSRLTEFTTQPCAISWKGYTLAWKAVVGASDGRLINYKIRYNYHRVDASDPLELGKRSENRETIAYVGDTWTPSEGAPYRKWITRTIPTSFSIRAPKGKTFLEGLIYLDAKFDVSSGDEVECHEGIDLRTGASRITYPFDHD